LGSAPDPAGELTALHRPLAGFKGAASRQGGEGKGRGMGRDGKTRVGKGRKGMEEGRGKGKWEGRDRTWDGEVKGKAGMGGKGGEGLQPPKH